MSIHSTHAPPPPFSHHNKYDPVMRAVHNRTLTPSLLIHYLREHYDVEGVRDFLVNQLYSLQDNEATFYIPQIV